MRDPSRIVLLAPLVFALHVAEEAPGFVAWFNARVEPDITPRLFASVNMTALFITLAVAALAAGLRDRASILLAFGWLALLFLANGVFHIVATLAQGRYAPGAASAALLYLPYFAWLFEAVARRFAMARGLLAAGAIAAGIPMFAHGALIVFFGTRLF
ncbi:MAG: HXXEE domain-containing protein [Pseudomonadota bacterium]